MSCLSRIFKSKSKDLALKKGIDESRESLLRLEIMTLELNEKDELAKSHEKLLEIGFNDLDTSIWGKDVYGHFVFMNLSCAEKILRTSVENGLALTDADFEHDMLAEPCMASDQIVLETKKTHRFIEHARYADDYDLWLDSTKSPWIIDGKLVGTVGVGKIITNMVPDSVKEKYKKHGFMEIKNDLLYRPEDIDAMMSAETL